MIGPMTLLEAENWAAAFSSRLLGMVAEAEQMAEFSASNFTEEHRKAGALVAKIDKRGQPVGWTDRDLEAVREGFQTVMNFAATMRGRQADGRSLLMDLQAIARPMREAQQQNGG